MVQGAISQVSSSWHPSMDVDSDFYNGLLLSTQIMVDVVASDSLNSKTLEQSSEHFEVIASNNY